MTIVCALRDGPRVWLGSDRQETVGHSERAIMPHGKWLLGKTWAMGISGEARLRDLLLARSFLLDEPGTAFDVGERLKAILKDDGFKPREEEFKPLNWGFGFILARPGELYEVDCVMHARETDWAVRGSGADYGTGVYFAMTFAAMSTHRSVIETAIRAAIAYDTGCGGEPWVYCLGS